GGRRRVKSAAVAAIAVDVRLDDRASRATHRPAFFVHEPQPHQADEEAARRGRRRHGREAWTQLARALGAPVDLREGAGELGAAAALAVELATELADVFALESHYPEGFARGGVVESGDDTAQVPLGAAQGIHGIGGRRGEPDVYRRQGHLLAHRVEQLGLARE